MKSFFGMLLMHVMLVSLSSRPGAIARVLTPYEQTIGDWDLSLNCRDCKVPSLLFPVGNAKDASRTRHTTNRLECHLSIFSNGTFWLEPRTKIADDSILSIHGKWKLKANPYCVTDRMYDQLVLESYPRVEKRIDDQEILQRVALRLDARVWGRYGSDPIRRLLGYNVGRAMGRMTHGTLLWNVQGKADEVSHKKAQRICATFTARPIVEGNSLHDDYDEDEEVDEL